MSRTTLIGALALGAVATLGVPAAAVPTVAEPDLRPEVLVSISAPTKVEPGEWAALGVTVRQLEAGVPVAGTVVVLLRRAAGEGDWAEAARTVTDADGRAVLTTPVKPPATDFRARVPGTDEHRKGQSARVTVTVD